MKSLTTQQKRGALMMTAPKQFLSNALLNQHRIDAYEELRGKLQLWADQHRNFS